MQIGDETVEVACGTGRNKVSWLCNASLHRVDRNYGFDYGTWASLEDESGAKILIDSIIADKIVDGSRVILKFEPIKVEEAKTSAPAAPKKK